MSAPTWLHVATAQAVGVIARVSPGHDQTPWRVLLEVHSPPYANGVKTHLAIVCRGGPASDLLRAFSSPSGVVGRIAFVTGEVRTRGCRMPLEEQARIRQDRELLEYGSLVQIHANSLRILPRGAVDLEEG